MDKIVGIMGGTFNPIHNGHIEMIKAVHRQFNIQKILVMPSGTPAYKDNSHIVSAIDRCNMVSLAIKEYPYMELSTMEVTRKGNTYTADTLKILKNDYDYIYFIIGADSLFALDTWYKPEYICSHCHLLAINRDSHSADELNRQKTYLHDKFGAEIDFVDCSNLPYSSTEIRDRLEQGLDISNYVPADVKSYIYDNQLYNSKAFKEWFKHMDNIYIEELRKKVKKALKDDKPRFRHTLGVANTAACLAMRYNENIEKAYISGLLHDCAKCVPDNIKISECQKYSIEITPVEYKSPYLLHAKLGAYYAKSIYNINDDDICNSIACHTTGKPYMSLLEKIIFLADYIEPYRNKASDLDKIRALAFVDIDEAVYEVLKDTVEYLKNKNANIDTTTIETYNYYKNLLNK